MNNRHRVKRGKCKSPRRRGELYERRLAHMCDKGGQRRGRRQDTIDVGKHYSVAVATYNLGQIQ